MNAEIKNIIDVKENDGAFQYLTFLIGNAIYGIDVDHIKEVIEYKSVLRIPLVPDFIKGVINLRGDVIPVVDLSARLYGKKADITKFTCVIILEIEDDGGSSILGVMIDAVKAVINLQPDEMDPSPEFGARIRTDFIHAVGKFNDEFIIILNLKRVLDGGELSNFGNMKDVRVNG